MKPLPLLLAAAVVLPACGGKAPPIDATGVPSAVCDPGAPACFLFERLDGWAIGGLATEVAGASPGEPEVVLGISFDDGDLGALGAVGEGAVVEDGALRLAWSAEATPWVETAPLEVRPDHQYTLTWVESAAGVKRPERRAERPAGVSVRFLDRRGKKLPLPRAAEWRPVEGTVAERRVERTFRLPGGAKTMVITAAGWAATRARDGSVVTIDDLGLVATPAPAWAGRAHDVWAEPGAHPLVRRVRARNDAHRKAREIRDAVLAPAPSTLMTKVTVPEGGRLAIGYGLTPGHGKGSVKFAVRLVDAAGATHKLHGGKVRGSVRPPWEDVELDLGAWAGQEVTLELATSGADPTGATLDDLGRGPDARAAWTTARLEGPAARRKLAVLVVLDTLGALHASAWDGPPKTTPALEEIGHEGVVFEQARAPSPWTLPSFASYLTGLNPDRHRAGQMTGRDHWNRRVVARSVDTVAERLARVGWQTAAWTNNPFLTARRSALDQGFQRWVDYGTRSREHAARPGVDQAVAELSRSAGVDRFVLVHLMEPHAPYRPDAAHLKEWSVEGYDGVLAEGMVDGQHIEIVKGSLELTDLDKQQLVAMHHGVIAQVDAEVLRLWEAARGSGDELLFVVTSDHGEEFWEHDRYEHGQSLYRELIHVPLLVAGDGWPARTRVPVAVDATGVAGAVLRFAGLDLGGVPALSPQMNPEPLYASRTLYGRDQRAIEEHGSKYFLRHKHAGRDRRRARGTDPRHQLVDLGEDADEAGNVLQERPELARELHGRIVRRAIEGMPGTWFVLAKPADGAPVDVVFEQSGGAGFWPDVHDFPWPRSDGKRYPRNGLKVDLDPARVDLTLRTGEVFAAVEPVDATGEVTVTVGGTAVVVETYDEGQLSDAIEAMLAAEPGFVVVGRIAGDVAGDAGGGASGSDLEALRALGYVE